MISIRGYFGASKRYDGSISFDLLPPLLKVEGAVFWIDLAEPGIEADIERVAKLFGYHPLTVEDCVRYVELPKIDQFEDYAFIITHGVRLGDDGEVQKNELDCFLGRNYLVSYHEHPSRSVSALVEKVDRNPEVLARGSDFLFHELLDVQVDNYMPILDGIDRELDRIEDEILRGRTESVLDELLTLRRTVLNLRRSIGPERDVVGRLARRDLPFVSERALVYFRDVYDHVARVHNMLETYRDVVAGVMDGYRSMVSQRLNEVMQRLTTLSLIFLPMTFVASVFGMNFHIPENTLWVYGYPIAVAVMAMVGFGFYLYFRSRKWI